MRGCSVRGGASIATTLCSRGCCGRSGGKASDLANELRVVAIAGPFVDPFAWSECARATTGVKNATRKLDTEPLASNNRGMPRVRAASVPAPESTASRVRRAVTRTRARGRAWRISDFSDMPALAVAQALSRLAREGVREATFGKGLPWLALIHRLLRMPRLATGNHGDHDGRHLGENEDPAHPANGAPPRGAAQRAVPPRAHRPGHLTSA